MESGNNLRRLESEARRLMRGASASTAITFGNQLPYHLEPVGFARIGFADIPAVGCICHCRSESVAAMVPTIRQHILRAIDAAGLDIAAVSLTVQVGMSARQRMFIDSNPASASVGKRKRGSDVRCHLELIETSLRKRFEDTLQRVYL